MSILRYTCIFFEIKKYDIKFTCIPFSPNPMDKFFKRNAPFNLFLFCTRLGCSENWNISYDRPLFKKSMSTFIIDAFYLSGEILTFKDKIILENYYQWNITLFPNGIEIL